ncbi:MAG: YraN family protein [Gemmatimonadales bacterium]
MSRVPSSRAPIPPSEWKDARHRRGLWGERVAMTFLARRGWRLEAHRFRVGRHELDVVARRGSLVAFVEVKTRGSAGWGSPAESVGWRKQRILGRVAEVWRERHGRRGDWFRFDVIEVEVCASGGYRVTHLEDAWRLGRSRCDRF